MNRLAAWVMAGLSFLGIGGTESSPENAVEEPYRPVIYEIYEDGNTHLLFQLNESDMHNRTYYIYYEEDGSVSVSYTIGKEAGPVYRENVYTVQKEGSYTGEALTFQGPQSTMSVEDYQQMLIDQYKYMDGAADPATSVSEDDRMGTSDYEAKQVSEESGQVTAQSGHVADEAGPDVELANAAELNTGTQTDTRAIEDYVKILTAEEIRAKEAEIMTPSMDTYSAEGKNTENAENSEEANTDINAVGENTQSENARLENVQSGNTVYETVKFDPENDHVIASGSITVSYYVPPKEEDTDP